MAEEQIKQVKKDGSEKTEGHGANSGKGQRELTPEELANVAGGYAEQRSKASEQQNKATHT